MKPEQRVKKLAEIEKLIADGVPAIEAAKRVGVTTTTYYTWRRGKKARVRARPPVTLEVPTPFRASSVALPIMGTKGLSLVKKTSARKAA